MSEVKFKQTESHQVTVRKVRVASLEDWEGNSIITEDDLKTYLAEGTTGDDEKDDFCWERVAEAECIDEEEIDWWSERKGCTEYEYEVIDD
jgi:hypothetical protein